MDSFREVVRLAQEMQRIHKEALAPFAAHQEALRSIREFQAAQTDIFRHVREQVLLRESVLSSLKADLSAFVRPAFDASRSIAAMLDATRIDKSIALFKSQAVESAQLSKAFQASFANDWRNQLELTKSIKDALVFPLQTHLTKLYELSAVAELSLSTVKSDHFGRKLGLPAAERTELASRHEDFSNEYRALYARVESSELGVLEVPSALTELPAAEFVNHTALVVSTSDTESDEETNAAQRVVTDELAVETSDQLTSLVVELNPDFALVLQGAREAFTSRRADFIRHFVTSYRELFTHILHLLSPDEDVKKWTKDPTHYHNNRPTRRARLLFITRELGASFGGFLSADVGAVTGFIDAFNKGTHEVNPKYTDEQLVDLKNRTEGLLRTLLVVHRVTLLGKQ